MTLDATHERWTDRLSDYLDGELAARDAQELERHLATCAECRGTLDDLRRVVARARTLPATEPATDLWPSIAARLADTAQESAPTAERADASPARRARPVDDSPRVLDVRRHPRWWQRPLTFSLAQAAAAAALLIVMAGGGAWLAFRALPQRVVAGQEPGTVIEPRRGPAPVADATPERERGDASPLAARPDDDDNRRVAATRGARALPRPGADAMPASAASLDPRYDATVAELQRLLVQERANLDTSTVRILEQNLALVDRALAEARRAVAADPNNPQLRSYLASTMRRKVDLLRRATVIAGAQG